MLKILQARLQQYVNRDLPDVQVVFRKGSGTRDQIAYIHCTIKKGRDFQKKKNYFALLTIPRPLTMWITTNCGKFLKKWEHPIQEKHEGIHVPRTKNYIPRILGTCCMTRMLTSVKGLFPIMCVLSRFSIFCLFVSLWTVAHQSPLCMRFFRQEYWSRLPFPSPGDLPDSGTEPASVVSPTLAGGFFTTSVTVQYSWTSYDQLSKGKGDKAPGTTVEYSSPISTGIALEL